MGKSTLCRYCKVDLDWNGSNPPTCIQKGISAGSKVSGPQGSKGDESAFLRIIRLLAARLGHLPDHPSTARSPLERRATTRLRDWTKRPFYSFIPKNSSTEFH